MNNLLVLLGVGVAGGLVLSQVAKFAVKWVKGALLKQLDFVKDEDLRQLFFQAIIIAQKRMGDASGLDKKSAAKAWLLKMIPDAFDSMVEQAFDAAWDELMEPLKAQWKDVPEEFIKEVAVVGKSEAKAKRSLEEA